MAGRAATDARDAGTRTCRRRRP